MAVVTGALSETRRRTLEAVCDTVAPSVEVDTDDAVLTDFFARAASELGVAAQLEELMAQSMMPEEIEAMGQLLDAIGDNEFAEQPLEVRTQILHAVANSSPEAKLGVRQLRALTLLFFYALPRWRRAPTRTGRYSDIPGQSRLRRVRRRRRRRSTSSTSRARRRNSRRTYAWSAPARAAR